MSHEPVEEAAAAVRAAARVFFFTGAGVSAESGVPTFRGAGGLWRSFRAEELATPEAFARDPRLVWEWYAWRREIVAACRPNAAHHAIARFVASHPGAVVVTQNVDGLHQRAAREAGADPDAIVALHGRLFGTRCSRCDARAADDLAIDTSSTESLPRCNVCGALLRPDIVWFGEGLPPMVLDRAFAAAHSADVCVVIGTSGVVQPAAGIVTLAARAGARVIEINPDATPLSPVATFALRGGAVDVVPALLGV
jgi:NAD-dependent deacetylase